jgi:hypothetical protein
MTTDLIIITFFLVGIFWAAAMFYVLIQFIDKRLSMIEERLYRDKKDICNEINKH